MFIRRLTLKKILSFNDTTVELGPLNVLIGPNAVGKSNLVEVIGLLQAAPTSLQAAMVRGGGIRQWRWLGDPDPGLSSLIECLLVDPPPGAGELKYLLELGEEAGGSAVRRERLARADEGLVFGERVQPGKARIQRAGGDDHIAVRPAESILSEFKHPGHLMTTVGQRFAGIRIYREFRTGPQALSRHGIMTTASNQALFDGADNLALVLLDMDFRGAYVRIRDYLTRFCERFVDVKVNLGEGGVARVFLRENGLMEMLSAVRMSDGTLKFLALLAALFHPNTPPLICIEEPEVGLHPDALRLVAEALVEASASTQLIVTTHSEALIDALGDQPDHVLVCERDSNNGTQMRRLSKDDLSEWLEHYSLGELWRKGEIGGGRW